MVVSRRGGRKTLIETYVSGESISGIFLSGFSVSRRDVPLEKGLRTGSEKVYHELAECLDITVRMQVQKRSCFMEHRRKDMSSESQRDHREHRAAFHIRTSNPDVVYAAALPEMGGDMGGRSSASLSHETDGRLLLSVEGEDISALRAAVNSYLRIIMIAEEMQEVLK